MSSNTIAVDLAKNVFELAVANPGGHILERRRLTRTQFERFWPLRERGRVIMEACGMAHFWARRLRALGFEVVLLPPHTVRPYVPRNKTDRRDCEAMLEAVKNPRIHPVSIKSEDQQTIAALHTTRSQWMKTRTARINGIRGLLREFGVVVPSGADKLQQQLPSILENPDSRLPDPMVVLVHALWLEIQDLEVHIHAAEQELKQRAQDIPVLHALQTIPGVGLLTATALYASIGNIHTFKSGRHLASWLGLTPKEHSTGTRRRLGRISKPGDTYLRMLLTHGARSALLAARRKENRGEVLSQLQGWALERARRSHPNQAVVALANKLARIVWAVWFHERAFDGNYVPQPQAA
jgi:transposase